MGTQEVEIAQELAPRTGEKRSMLRSLQSEATESVEIARELSRIGGKQLMLNSRRGATTVVIAQRLTSRIGKKRLMLLLGAIAMCLQTVRAMRPKSVEKLKGFDEDGANPVVGGGSLTEDSNHNQQGTVDASLVGPEINADADNVGQGNTLILENGTQVPINTTTGFGKLVDENWRQLFVGASLVAAVGAGLTTGATRDVWVDGKDLPVSAYFGAALLFFCLIAMACLLVRHTHGGTLETVAAGVGMSAVGLLVIAGLFTLENARDVTAEETRKMTNLIGAKDAEGIMTMSSVFFIIAGSLFAICLLVWGGHYMCKKKAVGGNMEKMLVIGLALGGTSLMTTVGLTTQVFHKMSTDLDGEYGNIAGTAAGIFITSIFAFAMLMYVWAGGFTNAARDGARKANVYTACMMVGGAAVGALFSTGMLGIMNPSIFGGGEEMLLNKGASAFPWSSAIFLALAAVLLVGLLGTWKCTNHFRNRFQAKGF